MAGVFVVALRFANERLWFMAGRGGVVLGVCARCFLALLYKCVRLITHIYMGVFNYAGVRVYYACVCVFITRVHAPTRIRVRDIYMRCNPPFPIAKIFFRNPLDSCAKVL